MIRPIYTQCNSRSGFVGAELKIALAWWKQILNAHIVEERFWKLPVAPVAHLFVDAAGKSARLVSCGVHWSM